MSTALKSHQVLKEMEIDFNVAIAEMGLIKQNLTKIILL